jgi:hypothetical protein
MKYKSKEIIGTFARTPYTSHGTGYGHCVKIKFVLHQFRFCGVERVLALTSLLLLHM